MGGLNIDVKKNTDKNTDPDAKRLQELLNNFAHVQHVTTSTHRALGTLDLVITFSDGHGVEVEVDPPLLISDHACIISVGALPHSTLPKHQRLVRSWRKVDRTNFSMAIRENPVGTALENSSIGDMFDTYNITPRRLADQFAPLQVVQARGRQLSPWFDDECKTTRRTCRRLERKCQRRREQNRLQWTEATRKKLDLFRKK